MAAHIGKDVLGSAGIPTLLLVLATSGCGILSGGGDQNDAAAPTATVTVTETVQPVVEEPPEDPRLTLEETCLEIFPRDGSTAAVNIFGSYLIGDGTPKSAALDAIDEVREIGSRSRPRMARLLRNFTREATKLIEYPGSDPTEFLRLGHKLPDICPGD